MLIHKKIVLLFESTISGIKITATSDFFFATRGRGVTKNLRSFKGGQANIYISLQGGRGGSKSPKSRLRSLWMTPYEDEDDEDRR